MAYYLTRIELHNADKEGEAYKKLHALMSLSGFMREIRANDGVTYKLPTAEYYSQHQNASSESVMNLAKVAANKVGFKYSVIVARCETISFDYLDVVKS